MKDKNKKTLQNLTDKRISTKMKKAAFIEEKLYQFCGTFCIEVSARQWSLEVFIVSLIPSLSD